MGGCYNDGVWVGVVVVFGCFFGVDVKFFDVGQSEGYGFFRICFGNIDCIVVGKGEGLGSGLNGSGGIVGGEGFFGDEFGGGKLGEFEDGLQRVVGGVFDFDFFFGQVSFYFVIGSVGDRFFG